MRPAKRTPGMWRDEQYMPIQNDRSQVSQQHTHTHGHTHHSPPLSTPSPRNQDTPTANVNTSKHTLKVPNRLRRLRVNLIQKPTPILLPEDPRKPPRLLLQRLHVQDLDEQHVARLRGLDVEGSRQVVDLGEVDVADVVGGVVVADLPACPVYAFDFDGFVGGDRGVGWDCAECELWRWMVIG